MPGRHDQAGRNGDSSGGQAVVFRELEIDAPQSTIVAVTVAAPAHPAEPPSPAPGQSDWAESWLSRLWSWLNNVRFLGRPIIPPYNANIRDNLISGSYVAIIGILLIIGTAWFSKRAESAAIDREKWHQYYLERFSRVSELEERFTDFMTRNQAYMQSMSYAKLDIAYLRRAEKLRTANDEVPTLDGLDITKVSEAFDADKRIWLEKCPHYSGLCAALRAELTTIEHELRLDRKEMSYQTFDRALTQIRYAAALVEAAERSLSTWNDLRRVDSATIEFVMKAADDINVDVKSAATSAASAAAEPGEPVVPYAIRSSIDELSASIKDVLSASLSASATTPTSVTATLPVDTKERLIADRDQGFRAADILQQMADLYSTEAAARFHEVMDARVARRLGVTKEGSKP